MSESEKNYKLNPEGQLHIELVERQARWDAERRQKGPNPPSFISDAEIEQSFIKAQADYKWPKEDYDKNYQIYKAAFEKYQ
jgi:hypothetical protein